MIKPDSWCDCGAGLRHALAFTGQLHQRIVVNQETVGRVARDLGLRFGQVSGVVRLIRKCGKLSPERLACIAMLDRGYDDDDIAEMFGRSKRWAQVVRERQEEIRRAERVPKALEWFDPELRPEDPSPDEVLRRAEVIRLKNFESGNAKRVARLPLCTRRANQDAFVPVGT